MAMFFPNSANDRPVAWKLISGICPPLTCWNTSSTIPMSPAILSAVSRTPETSRSRPANFSCTVEAAGSTVNSPVAVRRGETRSKSLDDSADDSLITADNALKRDALDNRLSVAPHQSE